MTRFNNAATSLTKTINHEGAMSYSMPVKLEFITILLTSFAQNSYYETADQTFDRLINLLDFMSDKQFAAKAAVYARNEFGMRSISHVVAAEIVHKVKGESWTKHFINKVVRRPDDMTEILSYYQSKYGRKPIPNALKKGFALAFNKFDQYQLAKYRGERNAISLVDIANIAHPRSTKDNEKALQLLVADKLREEKTRDAVMTEIGKQNISDDQKAEKKAQAWSDLIGNRKIGYFALIKNLRNIIDQAPEMIGLACKMVTDEELIRSSLVMPFRLYAAYKTLQSHPSPFTGRVLDALSVGLDVSCRNIPGLSGISMIGIDNSLSMVNNRISDKSIVTRADIACLLGAMLFKRTGDTLTSVFADTFQVCNLLKSNSVLANMGILRLASVGMGYNTNGYLVPEFVRVEKIHIDNFLIFTDLQMYDAEGVRYNRTPPTPGRSFKTEITKYRSAVNANAKVYSFDCAGYGTLQMPAGDPNSYLLAGYSDKMFDIIELLEKDRNALINTIEAIKL